MQHDEGEYKSGEQTVGDNKAAAAAADPRRRRLQLKYPSMAAQLAAYNAVAEQVKKFRTWQSKLKQSGKALNTTEQEAYDKQVSILQIKIEEANLLRDMIHEQRTAKTSPRTPTAVSSKPLLSNGAASPKPGVAPSRTPNAAEISNRIQSKFATIAEKHARRASLRKEVDAFAAWISKVQAATLTDDEKQVVKEKEALLTIKKREIEVISSLLRDQEAKQQQEAEEKEAATVADPFAGAAEESMEEDLTAQAATEHVGAAKEAEHSEEAEEKQQEADQSRAMEVSPTLDDQSPPASPASADRVASSSPPVLRHSASIVSVAKPRRAPKAAPLVVSKPSPAVGSKRKAIEKEDEDDVAEPFSPASPVSMSDEDEEWEGSKRKGGKGAKKSKASGKKPKAASTKAAQKRPKSIVGGVVSSTSKVRSKAAPLGLKVDSKNDPFSLDTLRADLMPQRKPSVKRKPGHSLLLNINKSSK